MKLTRCIDKVFPSPIRLYYRRGIGRKMHLSTYGLAFLEGMGLFLSPCILPILPIVLSLGIEGPKRRPYGIILGFVFSFASLTLLSRQLVESLNIDIEVIRTASFLLIFFFGLILVSDYLSEKFTNWTNQFANLGEKIAPQQAEKSGLLGGLLMGMAIGFTWVPCAGPIMAAVIVQTVTQQTTKDTVLTLLSFSFGTAMPMFVLVLMGRRFLGQLSFLKSYAHRIRKILGSILLISVLISAYSGHIWSIPDDNNKPPIPEKGLIHALSSPHPAPEIIGIVNWINSDPLTITQLKGKVVLVDFWTYSCINCVRTLPTLTKWDATYRDNGLVIIGIHSPEFEFEKKLSNVQNAVKEHQIQYPVALDNNFKTWLNFKNPYWPAHYLIDREGNVVYTHFGEGNTEITEANIRYLLGLNPAQDHPTEQKKLLNPLTPETYLGYNRGERFALPSTFHPDEAFTYPPLYDIPLNAWSLEGKWIVEKQRIVAQEAGAKIKLHFNARKVFLVLGNTNKKLVSARIILNGQVVGKNAGKDVHDNQVTLTKDTLYELASLPAFGEGLMEIHATAPGLCAYAFTFGE